MSDTAPPSTTVEHPGDASSLIAADAPIADAPKRLAEPVDVTAEEVFAANDHQVIEVPVDEWKPGGVIYIHTPSGGDKDWLEAAISTGTNPDGSPLRIGIDEVRASFIVMCARNSKGERIFSIDDIKRLKTKAVQPVDRLYQAIITASIITEKDVETIAKNSGAASTGTSS